MIPRTRRPDRVERAGLLVAPGRVNRRNDTEPPEPFVVLVPSGGLTLRAAWSACWSWARETGDARPGAAVAAFLALADAHEAAELPVVDDDGRPSRWSLHELDALGVVDVALGDDRAPATVARGGDGLLVVTPPSLDTLRAAAASEPEDLAEEVGLAPAPAPAPAPRRDPVREPAPRPAADPEPTPSPAAFTRPTSTTPTTPGRIDFPGTVRRRPGTFRAVTY